MSLLSVAKEGVGGEEYGRGKEWALYGNASRGYARYDLKANVCEEVTGHHAESPPVYKGETHSYSEGVVGGGGHGG